MEPGFIEAAAEEFATVVGALLDVPATASPKSEPAEAKWVVHLAFVGSAAGTLTLALDDQAARQLARQVMVLDEDPEDGAVADTLREVCHQAVGALSQRDAFKGVKIAETRIDSSAPEGEPRNFQIQAGDRFAGAVAFWTTAPPVAAPKPEPIVSQMAPPAGAPSNLEVILDIDLPLAVRFGETEMTLRALTRLAPGSVIDLGRSPDDPVDLMVNGRLVARGEVVVVSGNYGVRITEVISAADRLRTMAAQGAGK